MDLPWWNFTGLTIFTKFSASLIIIAHFWVAQSCRLKLCGHSIPLTCFSDSCHIGRPRVLLALHSFRMNDVTLRLFKCRVSLAPSLSDDSLHWDFSRSLSSVPPHTNNTWAQSYVNVQDVCLHCKVIKVGVAALSWRKLRRDSWIHHNPVYLLRERREEMREGEWRKRQRRARESWSGKRV